MSSLRDPLQFAYLTEDGVFTSFNKTIVNLINQAALWVLCSLNSPVIELQLSGVSEMDLRLSNRMMNQFMAGIIFHNK